MSHRNLLQQAIGVALLISLSAACSMLPPSSTPTPEPTQTPKSYYGIDDPASIQYVCSAGMIGIKGNSFNGFVTLVDAYQVESVTVQEDNVYPESGKVYFSIQTVPTFESNLCPNPQDIGRNLKLVCGENRFDASIFSLIPVADVGLNSIFTYEVSEDIDFSECYLLLPDEATIPIRPVLSTN